MKKHNALDLFSGCGGLSSGLEMAGFRVVAANDIWEPAAQTFRRNHPGTRFILGDIASESVREQIARAFAGQPCDVITGGPPCQAYSMSGARNVDDRRGHLFEDYVELVRRLRPHVFAMENVKGILTMEHDRPDLAPAERREMARLKDLEKERAALLLRRKQSKNTDKIPFAEADARRLAAVKEALARGTPARVRLREKVTDKIVRCFKEIGYRVEFRTLNAADHGVPQKRERVIFIGTRHGGAIEFPAPTHRPRGAGGPGHPAAGAVSWITVRQAIDDLKDVPEDPAWSHVFARHRKDFVRRLHRTPVGASVFGGYSDAWYRNPPDEPARTVKENHGGVLVHYEQDRVMTPRELARLQSFPDDFRVEDSKSMVLKQIGNAVPPLLGKAIGLSLKKMLARIEKQPSGRTPRRSEARGGSRPV